MLASQFSWKSRKNISIIALISGGTAIAAICLGIKNMVVTLNGNLIDLTNVFTFAIEIGIGVFISTVIFLYSKYQQNKSDSILTNIKEVNDNMQKEQTIKTEIYQKALLSCFSDIWNKCKLIKLNLDLYHVSEDLRNNPTILEENKVLADIINMNKIQLSLDLQELSTLALLSTSVMDSKLITLLLEYQKQSMDNVIQTGLIRATHPWSTMIIGIDRIIKKYFPKSIPQFKINDFERLLEPEFKEEIKQGR